MSTDEIKEEDLETGADEAKEEMNLDVTIESPSACQRHITVTIARDDIDRYYDDAFSEIMGSAAVPGFRAGRAPRKLVEARFRKDVTDQIKGSLLMDSMAQVNVENELAAISEPDIDIEAVDVPDDGPMTFEFDLEVRPDFDIPEWKGLKLERPVADLKDDDVDNELKSILSSLGRRVPSDKPAAKGDFVTVNITVQHEDETLVEASEQSLCLRPVLSFRDGNIDKFDQLMKGAKSGDAREASLTLSDDCPKEELAGKQVTVKLEVLDVKKFELPELTGDVLKEIGEFSDEGELRDAVRDSLNRRIEYQQQQQARQQVTKLLTEAAKWELPPDLLKRQSERELQRSVLELRRSGFSDPDIQAHVNQLRQNSRESTANALREHFILERISEEEGIEATDDDFDHELSLMAMQSGDSPRRVRAQIDKQGLNDSLRNQIIENKVIQLVLEHANFKDIPYKQEGGDVEAIDLAAAGAETPEIPVAKYSEAKQLAEPKEHK